MFYSCIWDHFGNEYNVVSVHTVQAVTNSGNGNKQWHSTQYWKLNYNSG